MASGQVDLQFPLGGINRRLSYQRQPPFTTPRALNVRSWDTLEKRARGGSRPGTRKAYAQELGGGSPVRLLATVRPLNNPLVIYTRDDFLTNPLEAQYWTEASWSDDAGLVETVYWSPNASSKCFRTVADVGTDTESAYYHVLPSDWDTSEPYTLALTGVPVVRSDDAPHGYFTGTYSVYGFLNDTTPAYLTNGFSFNCHLTSQDLSGAVYQFTLATYLRKYVGGVLTEVTGTSVTVTEHEGLQLSVLVNGTSLTGIVNGTTVVTTTMTATGHRFGFGLTLIADTYPLLFVAADRFTWRYSQLSTTTAETARRLVASAGGTVYYENDSEVLTAVSGDVNLRDDEMLQAQERAGNLYIADHGFRLSGTTGAMTTGVLDDAAVSDWTAHDIDTDNDVVVITAPAAVVGTYKITTVHATNGLTLTGTSASVSDVEYRVVRAPKVYDFDSNSLTIWSATSGSVPSECPCICLFQDSLYLGGGLPNPRLWYRCRQGDPLDWDFTADFGDIGRALAGTSTQAGVIADDIKAIFGYQDDFLIFGCDSSVYRLRGNPAAGGIIECIHPELGVLDKRAWCIGPGGESYFLSRHGLVQLVGNVCQLVAKDKIPDELINIDPTVYEVSLNFSYDWREVHIYLTPVTGSATHWVYDIQNQAFWMHEFGDEDAQPTASCTHIVGLDRIDRILIGGRDGYVRSYYNDTSDDDGTAFSNYVWIGPISLGPVGSMEGLITELNGTLGAASGSVTWSIHVGDSPETAILADALHSGTWTQGTNYRVHPRSRGQCFFFKITGTASQRWAFEAANAVIAAGGRFRKP